MRARRSTLLIWALLGAACREPAPPLEPAPDLLLSGCVAVDPGPVCVGADETITAWVALAEGEQVEAPAGAVAVAGGARVRLQGAGEVRVRGRAPVTVRVAPSPEGSPGRRLHV